MSDDDATRLAQAAVAGDLHGRGATVREIATALGVSIGTAHARVQSWLDMDRRPADVDDRRAARIREAAALDRWAAAVESHLEADPLAVVQVLLRVSSARRALLGLDAPARVQLADDRTPPEPDPEVQAAIRAVQKRNEDVRERAQGDG